MNERVGIIGSGYVGLVTGACFMKFGHTVYFHDIDVAMLQNLSRGIVPIHEDHLQELIDAGIKNRLLHITPDKKEVLEQCDIIMLCLPTPPKEDGNADLRFIRAVCKELGQAMNSHKILINKSTAPVGSSKLIREIIRHFYNGNFDVVSMPEFLQEGKAVESSLNADRYVIGFEERTNRQVKDRVLNLLKPFNSQVVVTNNKTAELAKYICNAFLPLEISFINSMTGICEKLGVDIKDITQIMRLDKRIGPKAFLEAGPGYGGMCFPKDVWSIISISDRFGYTHKLLQVVDEINERQKINVVNKIETLIGSIRNPIISILGLSFKKNTSDVRLSQSKTVIEELLRRKFDAIIAYDPAAISNFRKFELPIRYAETLEEAVKNSDCLVIMTEWDEFKHLNLPEMKKVMHSLNIVDGRNLLDKSLIKELGFHYIGMGRL
jgi:UDPglucose 6-dehydrogenase